MTASAYFNRVAPQWDAMQQQFFSDGVRDRAITASGIGPGLLALDVGAGSGFLTTGLLALGARVAALDTSEKMLAALALKFPEEGRLQCRRASAESLPFPDTSADAVLANMCLHHLEHPAVGIGEMARVLKPGGRLVITDLDSHAFEFLRTEHHDRWMGFPRDQVAAWLTEAGLVAVAVEDARETCCACSAGGGHSAEVGIFIASATRPGGLIPSAAQNTAVRRASDRFDAGWFCAESVLAAVADIHQIASNAVPRIASGFCGGMSRTGGLCGALTGGIMALGLLYGRTEPETSRDRVYAQTAALIDTFEARFGATGCTDLLGCDISTPRGSELFGQRDLMAKICRAVTADTAGMVMHLVETLPPPSAADR